MIEAADITPTVGLERALLDERDRAAPSPWPPVGVSKSTPPAPKYPPTPGAGWPRPQAPTPAPAVAPKPPEVRALWVSRFDPGSPPLKRGSLEAVIDKAADAGFNTLLLQVRATGDAYYTPGVEPWSYRLTSSRVADLGRDPGWDPLAVAIERAHRRGLTLHAYLNAFTLWECGRGAPPHTTPEHPYWTLANYHMDARHYDPSWRAYAVVSGTPAPMGDARTNPVACAEYIWASAGVDRVHEHNLAVMRDIVARYAVDGIHLDRVRYPGRQYSHDPETYAAWRATRPPTSLEHWQRDHLSQWMGRYREGIQAVRPEVTFSAAVWFTYKKTAAMQFATSQGYTDYYQDSHRWLRDGSVDALAPMIYGETFNADIEKWKVLAADHVQAQGARQVWLGVGADLPDFGLLAARMAYARELGARGIAIWSAGGLEQRGYWDDLARLWAAGPGK